VVRTLPERTVKCIGGGGGVEIQLHSLLIMELDGDDV
jgi:hydroxymethylglutaryl-CoA reductase